MSDEMGGVVSFGVEEFKFGLESFGDWIALGWIGWICMDGYVWMDGWMDGW